MKRTLFNLSAVLSLLLLAATVVLWVRSYWRLDTWEFVNRRWDMSNPQHVYSDFISLEIGCARGTIFLHTDCGHASHSSSAGLQAFDLRDGLRFQNEHYMYSYSYPELVDQYEYAWKWHGVSYLWYGDFPFTKPLGKGYGSRKLAAPAWMACLLLAFLPAVFKARAVRKRDLIRQHRCLTCGYFLNGNTSGVCPECGTPVAGKAGA